MLPSLAGLALVWSLATAWHSSLPATIPLHFDLAGTPDGEGSRTSWFLPPVIATLVVAFVVLVGAIAPGLTRHHPEFVNLPSALKQPWLALDREARVRAMQPMQWTLGSVAFAVSVLHAWILANIRWVAMDPDPANPPRTLVGGVVAIGGFLGWILASVLLGKHAVERRVKEEALRVASPPGA